MKCPVREHLPTRSHLCQERTTREPGVAAQTQTFPTTLWEVTEEGAPPPPSRNRGCHPSGYAMCVCRGLVRAR